jgi:hypothetical protein
MPYPIVHDGQMFTETGRIEDPVPATDLLNCGHRARPASGVAAGFAILAGYTLCYPCMDEWERSFMASSDVFTGYVTGNHRTFTTWTGGELARVTNRTVSRRIRMPYGGDYRRIDVRAVAPDGSRWYGHASDAHDLITLRRARTPQPVTETAGDWPLTPERIAAAVADMRRVAQLPPVI